MPHEDRRQPPQVFMVWMNTVPGKDTFQTLAYYGGKGQIRVYYKDRYDPRCDLGLEGKRPYFDNATDAVVYMSKNRGTEGMCQVHHRCAKAFGFQRQELAQVEVPLGLLALTMPDEDPEPVSMEIPEE
jgi:hypothetical protein